MLPALSPVGPDDLHGLLRNGNAAAQRGDLDEAIAWFRQAASVAPDLAVAHYCHGVCLWSVGRIESSMRALSRAVDLDPSDGAARIQLARVQLKLGDTSDAMAVLSPVVRDVPEFLDIMRGDPDFSGVADHPLFLAMAGVL
jgi:tetratricopeptide (TPR) repeat protein